MAEFDNKTADNIDGMFYVDNECIACDACVIDALAFFKMNKISENAFVYCQPETPSEIKICNDALDNCPVEAIGIHKL